jgi:hypothetical protein
MGIAVFTVYFLTLAVLLWADALTTWSGFLVMVNIGVVGVAVIRATWHMMDR